VLRIISPFHSPPSHSPTHTHTHTSHTPLTHTSLSHTPLSHTRLTLLPFFFPLTLLLSSSSADEADISLGSDVPLELQRLFWEMETAAANGIPSVGTEKLTRSFGWGPREVNEQQDVSEFWQMLYQLLRDSASRGGGGNGGGGGGGGGNGRGDAVAAQRERLDALFEGRTLNYVRCTKVDFRREREERFTDLQMQVSGCGSLMDSFRHLIAEEKLTGENRYKTPSHGRQEARKGARFTSLPPVLQLHLKRFEYDPSSGMMRKLQQAFTYPTRLKLGGFLAKGADKAAPSPVYRLYAVLSHAGNVGSGHYVAYVRPLGSDQWYEFDDTRVRAVSEEAAVKAQYGGDYSRAKRGFFDMGAPPNAYMLTYVRESTVREAKCGGAQPPGDGLSAALVRRFEQQAKGGARQKGRSAVRARGAATPMASVPIDSLPIDSVHSVVLSDEDDDLFAL